MFGNPEVTSGGRALKFYASVRLDIRKIDTIKVGLDAVGSRVRVKVVKNKVAPPFRNAEFDILYNEGISFAGSVLDMAVDARIIDKSGAWFSYGDLRLGQGRENVRDFLKQNPELLEEIANRVRAHALPATAAAEEPAESPAGRSGRLTGAPATPPCPSPAPAAGAAAGTSLRHRRPRGPRGRRGDGPAPAGDHRSLPGRAAAPPGARGATRRPRPTEAVDRPRRPAAGWMTPPRRGPRPPATRATATVAAGCSPTWSHAGSTPRPSAAPPPSSTRGPGRGRPGRRRRGSAAVMRRAPAHPTRSAGSPPPCSGAASTWPTSAPCCASLPTEARRPTARADRQRRRRSAGRRRAVTQPSAQPAGGGPRPRRSRRSTGPSSRKVATPAAGPEDHQPVEGREADGEAAQGGADGAPAGQGHGVEGHQRRPVGRVGLRAVGQVGDRGRSEPGQPEDAQRGDAAAGRAGPRGGGGWRRRSATEKSHAPGTARRICRAGPRRGIHGVQSAIPMTSTAIAADQDQRDQPGVEVVHQPLAGDRGVVEEGREVGPVGADEGEGADPGGEEAPDGPRPERRPAAASRAGSPAAGARGRRSAGRPGRRPGRRPPARGSRPVRGSGTRTVRATKPPAYPARVAASKAPLARARVRTLCEVAAAMAPERGGHEGGGGAPPPGAGPRRSAGSAAEAATRSTPSTPISGPADHEELAAQPVGEARQEGGEDHLGERLGGADQPDGGAVRVAVGQVGEVELHGHRDPGGGHPDQGGAGQERGGSSARRVSRSPCSSSATRSGAPRRSGRGAAPGWPGRPAVTAAPRPAGRRAPLATVAGDVPAAAIAVDAARHLSSTCVRSPTPGSGPPRATALAIPTPDCRGPGSVQCRHIPGDRPAFARRFGREHGRVPHRSRPASPGWRTERGGGPPHPPDNSEDISHHDILAFVALGLGVVIAVSGLLYARRLRDSVSASRERRDRPPPRGARRRRAGARLDRPRRPRGGAPAALRVRGRGPRAPRRGGPAGAAPRPARGGAREAQPRRRAGGAAARPGARRSWSRPGSRSRTSAPGSGRELERVAGHEPGGGAGRAAPRGRGRARPRDRRAHPGRRAAGPRGGRTSAAARSSSPPCSATPRSRPARPR